MKRMILSVLSLAVFAFAGYTTSVHADICVNTSAELGQSALLKRAKSLLSIGQFVSSDQRNFVTLRDGGNAVYLSTYYLEDNGNPKSLENIGVTVCDMGNGTLSLSAWGQTAYVTPTGRGFSLSQNGKTTNYRSGGMPAVLAKAFGK